MSKVYLAYIVSAANKGRVKSPEWLAKIAAGRRRGAEQRKAIRDQPDLFT